MRLPAEAEGRRGNTKSRSVLSHYYWDTSKMFVQGFVSVLLCVVHITHLQTFWAVAVFVCTPHPAHSGSSWCASSGRPLAAGWDSSYKNVARHTLSTNTNKYTCRKEHIRKLWLCSNQFLTVCRFSPLWGSPSSWPFSKSSMQQTQQHNSWGGERARSTKKTFALDSCSCIVIYAKHCCPSKCI